MVKRIQFITGLAAVLGLVFLFMACGGSGGGGGDVVYEGSTDPAVADSTTAPTLAEYGIGAVEAGFPLATPFAAQPPGMIPDSLAAEPLAAAFQTVLIMNVPPEATIYGIDYGPSGSGSYEINGIMTLYLGSDSATADTWYVEYAELDGSITFDEFRTDDEADVTGTVTIPSGGFYFSGEAAVSLSEGDFLDNPGFPIWAEVEMTFNNITVSEDGDSWALGEGDWFLDFGIDSVVLDIYSMTVEYDGSTYKLEDTEVYVQFGGMVPAALAATQPLIAIEETNFQFSGIEADNGTFYHPELGVIYFSGDLTEADPPGEIVEGELHFYDAATEGNSVFFIYFGYDELYNEGEGATVYELNMETEEYYEIGYFIDGEFIKDPSAPSLG